MCGVSGFVRVWGDLVCETVTKVEADLAITVRVSEYGCGNDRPVWQFPSSLTQGIRIWCGVCLKESWQ